MLSNRKYIGEYRFKDIVIEDAIPAIIDKDLFEKVQKRIAVNTRAFPSRKAAFLYFQARYHVASTRLFSLVFTPVSCACIVVAVLSSCNCNS